MSDLEYLKKYLTRISIEEGEELLKKGLPVQYIVGDVDFLGNKIFVDENVLIPRFETEYLVYKLIEYSKRLSENINIVDIGTGSGCIAISLAKKLKCSVTALDISEKALELAKKNALVNSVDINFIKSDMTSNLNGKYNIIVSNPPYIDPNEEVMDLVYNNEPHLALFVPGGIYYYNEILKNASNFLLNSSIIAFEIGHTQGELISSMAHQYFPNSEVLIEKDLQDKERFVFIFINC